MAAAREAKELFPSISASILIVLIAVSSWPPWPLVSALTKIKQLPGFRGPLPFSLETGYVTVDEANDVNLFYYFIESEMKPELDPLIVWISGGPGCSAFSGLVYEIGPVKFDVAGYTEGLPTFTYHPYAWTKVSNVIFLDTPVGTGFSYAGVEEGYQTGDTKSSRQVCTFLRKWLADHPDFVSNPLYIGGDSYSGLVVPLIAQMISEGNEAGDELFMNLKGYLVGNGATERQYDGGYKVPYAHGFALISDELYESTKKSCGGDYITPRNAECANYLQDVDKCILGINYAHILEPVCFYSSRKPSMGAAARRISLEVQVDELSLSNLKLPTDCRGYGYLLSYYWANNDTVREVLGIRKGTVKDWQRCHFGLPYTGDSPSSLKFHLNLTSRGYRALVYSGDHDMAIPFLGTQAWIRTLNFPIVDDWRPWHVDGQVAGYTRTYSNNLTFATVKGAGHTAPEYRPKECLGMLRRWLLGRPL